MARSHYSGPGKGPEVGRSGAKGKVAPKGPAGKKGSTSAPKLSPTHKVMEAANQRESQQNMSLGYGKVKPAQASMKLPVIQGLQ